MQMSVLIILIIVSVLVAGGFLIAFLWSVKSGQMEDDYTPSVRMLFDDELTEKNISKSKIQS
jgi:cbb3-type cytochrome oxidase maturation protein